MCVCVRERGREKERDLSSLDGDATASFSSSRQSM